MPFYNFAAYYSRGMADLPTRLPIWRRAPAATCNASNSKSNQPLCLRWRRELISPSGCGLLAHAGGLLRPPPGAVNWNFAQRMVAATPHPDIHTPPTAFVAFCPRGFCWATDISRMAREEQGRERQLPAGDERSGLAIWAVMARLLTISRSTHCAYRKTSI